MTGAWEYEKIVIGVPMSGPIEHQWFTALSQQQFVGLQGERFPSQMITMKRAPIDKARDWIADQALKAGATKIFWVDSDTILPDPMTFAKMYRIMKLKNAKIVSGVYWSKKGEPAVWNIEYDDKGPKLKPFKIEYDYVNQNGQQGIMPKSINDKPIDPMKDDDCIINPDLSGGGLILVDTEVYENIDYPYYDFELDYVSNPRGFGEDFYFLNKAKAKGYKLYVDVRIVGLHTYTVMIGPDGRQVGVPP